MRSKTASRTTLLQSVIVEDVKLLQLAEQLIGADPRDSLWLRGGLARLQHNFTQLKRDLELHHTPYTLGSLRAGGCSGVHETYQQQRWPAGPRKMDLSQIDVSLHADESRCCVDESAICKPAVYGVQARWHGQHLVGPYGMAVWPPLSSSGWQLQMSKREAGLDGSNRE
eukprot:5888163-Amphidinium_carterae.1